MFITIAKMELRKQVFPLYMDNDGPYIKSKSGLRNIKGYVEQSKVVRDLCANILSRNFNIFVENR